MLAGLHVCRLPACLCGRRRQVLLLLHGRLAVHDAALGLGSQEVGHLQGRHPTQGGRWEELGNSRGSQPNGRPGRNNGSRNCPSVCSCVSQTPLNSQTHLAEADQCVAVLVLPPQQVFTLQAGVLAQRLVMKFCGVQAGGQAGYGREVSL